MVNDLKKALPPRADASVRSGVFTLVAVKSPTFVPPPPCSSVTSTSRELH